MQRGRKLRMTLQRRIHDHQSLLYLTSFRKLSLYRDRQLNMVELGCQRGYPFLVGQEPSRIGLKESQWPSFLKLGPIRDRRSLFQSWECRKVSQIRTWKWPSRWGMERFWSLKRKAWSSIHRKRRILPKVSESWRRSLLHSNCNYYSHPSMDLYQEGGTTTSNKSRAQSLHLEVTSRSESRARGTLCACS